jgi:hypothetical protein
MIHNLAWGNIDKIASSSNVREMFLQTVRCFFKTMRTQPVLEVQGLMCSIVLMLFRGLGMMRPSMA